MKDGKFESTVDLLKTLISGASIGHSDEVFKLDERGNMTINGRIVYNFHLYSPSSYHIAPSPAYYIPKDNSFAYLIADGTDQLKINKRVAFDGSEIAKDSCCVCLSNLTSVTKEQAERRVNSWWIIPEPSRYYAKIENGIAYCRDKLVPASVWVKSESVEEEINYLNSREAVQITRAECEAAFRETFDFATAMKHVMDGKTVARKSLNSDEIYQFKLDDNRNMIYHIVSGIGWFNLATLHSADIDAQYWLAE